jgi:hypothetical protein
MFRFWILVAGLCNIAAVAAIFTAASLGAGNGGPFFGAQAIVLALLNVPILAIAALLAATDGRRHIASTWLLNVAAMAYLVCIVISSFLVFPAVDQAQRAMASQKGVMAAMFPAITLATYVTNTVLQYFSLLTSVAGVAFVVAWLALAVSALGFKRLKSESL